MENKKKDAFPVWIGIAATWFGMHCGSGFATGKQYTIYYNPYGWLAMITPLITWGILAVAFYFIFEYSRRTNVLNYKDYVSNAFGGKFSFIFLLLFDGWSIFSQILGEAGILAGSGSLAEGLGINFWVGVIVVAILVLLLVVFGATAIMKGSMALTLGLVVCITILGIVGVVADWDNFVRVLAERQTTPGTTFVDAIKGALTYSGVQIGSIFALTGLTFGLKSKSESKQAAFGGAFLNVSMLMILGMVMIANFPGINDETLPVLTALSKLNMPILTVLYQIMLFLALITTGAGCGFAIVSRFKEPVMKLTGWSELIASSVIAVILMAVGIFGSQFGLAAVFSTGYGYLSKLAWPLGILPALLWIPYKLKKLGKENNTPVTGE